MKNASWGQTMSEITRLTESHGFKSFLAIVQALFIASIIGSCGMLISSFNTINGSLDQIKALLNLNQTTIALQAQDIDSLKRSRDAMQLLLNEQGKSLLQHGFQIDQLTKPVSSGGTVSRRDATYR